MESYQTELTILQKSFPFINFFFENIQTVIKIWINGQYDRSNMLEYNFWYSKYDKEWVIECFLDTIHFNEFLDQFIEGLIQYNFY